MSEDRRGQTAFVVGATGYVGRQVVRMLCEQGVRTIAHIRPTSSQLGEWQQRFVEHGAEIEIAPWNEDAIRAALARHAPTLVFALLGTTRTQARAEGLQGNIYEAVDYRLSKMLLDASVLLPSKPRFIYLSAIGASEEARSAYMRVRGRIERELGASGLSYLSAQPALIVGHDRDQDRRMERWGAAIGDGALSLAARLGGRRLQERYQSTSATQLAEALVRLSLSEAEGVVQGAELRGDAS